MSSLEKYDQNHIGETAESAVIHHLLTNGFNVSIPFNDVQYDLVAERNGELLRIQVKSARERGEDSIVCVLNSSSRPSGTKYSDDAFDLLAMHHIKSSETYYAIWSNIGDSKFQINAGNNPRRNSNLEEEHRLTEVIERYGGNV